MVTANTISSFLLLLWSYCCLVIGDVGRADGVRADFETGRLLPVPMHEVYRGRFGHSVDMKGNHVIVGAPHVHLGLYRSIGSVIIYTYDGTQWDKGVPLIPSEGAVLGSASILSEGNVLDGYGKSVAMGTKYAVVSSPYESRDDRKNSGAVYIYENYYGMWTLTRKFISSHNNRGYLFGNTVAVYGDTVVIGSPMSVHGTSKGSVYIFTNKEGYWTEQAVLAPLSGMRAENFGSDVAIYANTIVVFSYWKDYHGEYSCVLFVYRKNKDGNWAIETILLPPVRHQLTRTFPVFPKMKRTGRFGASINIHGDEEANTIVMGEPDENDSSGVAFIYTKFQGEWSLETTLKPSIKNEHYKFGSSVAVYGDMVAVSELGSSDVATRSQASVYLFKRSGYEWRLVRRLFASDGKKRDGVGGYVAMDNGVLATASFNQWGVSKKNGPVYLFDVQDLMPRKSAPKEIII